MSVKLLALATSHRPDSLNKRLLAIAVQSAQKSGAIVTELDYARLDAPLYKGESATDIPAGAQVLSDGLKANDGLLLASPEYNWSIPGHLKNLIDWLSIDPFNPFKNRSGLLLCASPSQRGGILGLHQLSLPLAHLGMHVYPHLIAIGDAESQLTEGGIANAKDAEFLEHCVTDFVRLTNTSHRG